MSSLFSKIGYMILPKELQVIALVNEIRKYYFSTLAATNKSQCVPISKYLNLEEFVFSDLSLICHVDIPLILNLLQSEGQETWTCLAPIFCLGIIKQCECLNQISCETKQTLLMNAAKYLMKTTPTYEDLMSKTFESSLFLIETFSRDIQSSDELFVAIINAFRQSICLIKQKFEPIFENNALICLEFLETHHQVIDSNTKDIFDTLVDGLEIQLPSKVIVGQLGVIEKTHRVNTGLDVSLWIQKLKQLFDYNKIDLNEPATSVMMTVCRSLIYLNANTGMIIEFRRQFLKSLLCVLEYELDYKTKNCIASQDLAEDQIIDTIVILISDPLIAFYVSHLPYPKIILRAVANGKEKASVTAMKQSRIISRVFDQVLCNFSFDAWATIAQELFVPGLSSEKLSLLTQWLLSLTETGISINTAKYLVRINNKSESIIDHLTYLFHDNKSVSYLSTLFGLMRSNRDSFSYVVATGALKTALYEALTALRSVEDKSIVLLILYILESDTGTIDQFRSLLVELNIEDISSIINQYCDPCSSKIHTKIYQMIVAQVEDMERVRDFFAAFVVKK